MSDLIDESDLRVHALNLAAEHYGHNDPDVVVTAAEEFLDFLLDGSEEVEDEPDDTLDDEPDVADNGAPFVAKFFLTEEAVIYLSTVLAVGLGEGVKMGLGDTMPQMAIANDPITLEIIQKGARV